VQAGLVLGSDIFIDPADNPTFMGSVKWAPPNGRDSVLFSVILGSGRRLFADSEELKRLELTSAEAMGDVALLVYKAPDRDPRS